MTGLNTAKIGLDHQCVTEYTQEKEVSIILPKNLTSPLSLLMKCQHFTAFQQKKFKHGIKFEPVARDKYYDVMKHYLRGQLP